MPGRTSLIVFALFGVLSFPAQAETIQVVMDKMAFMPTEVTAKVGDTIEFVNKDIVAHTATATNGDWNAVTATKQTARVEMKKAGVADYFCKYHPNMKGRVTVAP